MIKNKSNFIETHIRHIYSQVEKKNPFEMKKKKISDEVILNVVIFSKQTADFELFQLIKFYLVVLGKV